MKNLMTKTMKTLAALGMTMGLALGAQAADPVEYLEPVYKTIGGITSPTNGIDHWETKSTSDYQLVTTSTAKLSAGWWVVDGTVSRDRITVEGAAHLILKDGCLLTVQENDDAAIKVSGDGNSLAIYGQNAGTGKLTAKSDNTGAAIGGDQNGAGSNITINGGTVEATCVPSYGVAPCGAAIGGGDHGAGSNITINGGTVTATCVAGDNGASGAAIGGGEGGTGSNITINGGTVTATGGERAAGIGSGADATVASSGIYVNPLLTLKADGNNPPTTVIANTGADLANTLKGQQYATAKIDYTIVLTNGVAYKSADGGKTLGDVITPKGLSYADSVWTMSNFVFKTTARIAVSASSDDFTIKLVGANSVQSGDTAEGESCGMSFRGDLTFVGTAPASDSLTVTAGSSSNDSGESVAVKAADLVILNATVNLNAAVAPYTSYGAYLMDGNGNIAVTNANLVVKAVQALFSCGACLYGEVGMISIGEGGSAQLTANGGSGNDSYAFASMTGEHDFVAYDAQTLEPLPVAMKAVDEIGCVLTNSVGAYATNVILTAKPSVPIEAKPNAAPEHATIAAVLTNGVEAAEIAGKAGFYPAWSNGTAVVVYTADAGWCFENGQTEVTNKLDTSVNPAVNKSGEVIPKLGQPKVQLGIVAQRYPWDGKVDVQYKAQYVKDTLATLTVEANGQKYTQDVTISVGIHTLEFTKLPAEIKAKDAKVTLKLK